MVKSEKSKSKSTTFNHENHENGFSYSRLHHYGCPTVDQLFSLHRPFSTKCAIIFPTVDSFFDIPAYPLFSVFRHFLRMPDMDRDSRATRETCSKKISAMDQGNKSYLITQP